MNMKLRCFQSTRKLQSWFSVKERQALLNRLNIVYKLTCSCGASYIGQKQHNLINRVEEHQTSLSSSVCRHLQANPDHGVDFHNPEVIGNDNWRQQQILESLLIQEHKPRCLYVFLTCNRASCFTHDVTHHHQRIQLSHVTTYASRHYVTTETVFCVYHFFTALFSWMTNKNLQQDHCSYTTMHWWW